VLGRISVRTTSKQHIGVVSNLGDRLGVADALIEGRPRKLPAGWFEDGRGFALDVAMAYRC
jgi:hypothetical protein